MSLNMLTTKAQERSTFAVTVSYFDEGGVAVTPDTMTWTLSDTRGESINSRTDVTISVPATSNTIILSGADLALTGNSEILRIVTFEGTYTSGNGSGLPLKQAVGFLIEPIVAQAA